MPDFLLLLLCLLSECFVSEDLVVAHEHARILLCVTVERGRVCRQVAVIHHGQFDWRLLPLMRGQLVHFVECVTPR